MVRVETLGQIEICKNNPVVKSENDVANYSFITVDGDLYLVANTLTGDDAGKEDVVIKAGDFLNCFLVEAWKGQKLVADEKHIAYGESQSYASITAGTTLLKANAAGKLEITASAPTSGVFFKVTDKVTLTENAVKMKVMVVDKDTVTA